MEGGAKGIRIQMSGRLGGAEMARMRERHGGQHSAVDAAGQGRYGFTEATTAQGNIGIKVWINNGDYLTRGDEQCR